jgi:hypothetical protein
MVQHIADKVVEVVLAQVIPLPLPQPQLALLLASQLALLLASPLARSLKLLQHHLPLLLDLSQQDVPIQMPACHNGVIVDTLLNIVDKAVEVVLAQAPVVMVDQIMKMLLLIRILPVLSTISMLKHADSDSTVFDARVINRPTQMKLPSFSAMSIMKPTVSEH